MLLQRSRRRGKRLDIRQLGKRGRREWARRSRGREWIWLRRLHDRLRLRLEGARWVLFHGYLPAVDVRCQRVGGWGAFGKVVVGHKVGGEVTRRCDRW